MRLASSPGFGPAEQLVPAGYRSAAEHEQWAELTRRNKAYTPPDPAFIPGGPTSRVLLATSPPPMASALSGGGGGGEGGGGGAGAGGGGGGGGGGGAAAAAESIAAAVGGKRPGSGQYCLAFEANKKNGYVVLECGTRVWY